MADGAALRALLYSSASRLEPGGVQAVFSRLAASLRRCGHEIVEAWPDGAAGAGEWTCPLEFRTGYLGLPGPAALWRGGQGLTRLAARLARYRPEIVNVHYVRGDSLYFLLLRRLFGYRLVLSLHGSDLLRPGGPVRRLLPRADAVTVVSRQLLERVLDCPGMVAERVRYIPNGIDHGFWAGTDPTATHADRPPTVVWVGRLIPVKGVDMLLAAFARLHRDLPAARLWIVGDGESRGALTRQAADLGLDDQVTFTGQLDSTVLRTRLGQATVFALPSRSEGLPLALLEAMAAGLPAVASAVGGVPEVLDACCGRLVPPEDPAALAAALAAVLRDPRRATMGKAARRRAAAFSSASADAAYERLFLELRGGAL